MRKSKKVNKALSLILGVSLLLTSVFGTMAAPVQANAGTAGGAASSIEKHWAGNVLKEWSDKGYIKGDQKGNLQPDAKISRAQVAALINRSFHVTETTAIAYSDVKKKDWFYEDAAKATAKGYIKGYTDGTFKPSAFVSRQELAVILTSLLQLKASSGASISFEDTQNSPAWSKGAIEAVVEKGLMQGSGNKFKPQAFATRAETVTVLDRALKYLEAQQVTTYDKAGEYGPASGTETIRGSVRITAEDVKLRNLVIEGNLLLGAEIGEGDVYLNNVVVKGSTTIEGGGKNSIHVEDSMLVTVIVNKKDGSIRIVVEGDSQVSQVTLQSGAILEEYGLTGAGFQDVILSDRIPANSEVALAGKFETVDVVATSLKVNLRSGSISELTVGNSATGNQISVNASAVIASIILNAAANVTGQGSIGNAVINASGSTFSQRPGNVTYNNNSTASIPASSSNSGSGSSGSNGSNNGGSQSVISALNVTNGKATLIFTTSSAPNLALEDLIVVATVAGDTYELTNVSFNNATKELVFDPFSLEEHYGQTLSLKISPANGVTKFSGTITNSVRLEGFAGTIVDVDDVAVEGVTIKFRRGTGNTTGSIAATVTTDQYGRYQVNLPAGIYTGEINKAGFINSYVVGVSASDIYNQNENATAIKIPNSGELRIVLTWGEYPLDEDSHLVGPTPSGHKFHTWYGDKLHMIDEEVYADLDHDDVDSYGPETTTIRKRVDGVYTFYVHNYSGNGEAEANTLRNSSAKVEIYDASGTPLKTYHIPTGNGGELYWHVFDMTIAGDQISFADQNVLTEEAPIEDPGIDPEYDILWEEAYKILSVTSVTYDTPLSSVVGPFMDANNPLLDDTRVSVLQVEPEISVTDDVYVDLDEETNQLVFVNYNDSGDTVRYWAEIEVARGDLSVTIWITIIVPTLDAFLNDAVSAVRALDRPDLEDEINAAVDLLNGGSTEEKIEALQSLLSKL